MCSCVPAVVNGEPNGYHSQLTTPASTPEVTEDAMEQVRGGRCSCCPAIYSVQQSGGVEVEDACWEVLPHVAG